MLCDRLTFTTSKRGRQISAGGNGGGPVVLDMRTSNPYVIGLEAGMGGHVHNIAALYIDLNAGNFDVPGQASGQG